MILTNTKIQLYNDDCFTVMKSMIKNNQKFDAIICDPPYEISYVEWDNEFNMGKAIDLCFELLKDNGNLVLFQGWTNVAKTKSLLDEKFTIQNWIVWDRIKGRAPKRILFQQEKTYFGTAKVINQHTTKFIQIYLKRQVVWVRKMVNTIEH